MAKQTTEELLEEAGNLINALSSALHSLPCSISDFLNAETYALYRKWHGYDDESEEDEDDEDEG